MVHQRRIHNRSSLESGFEAGTFWFQSRDLTTRPPQLKSDFESPIPKPRFTLHFEATLRLLGDEPYDIESGSDNEPTAPSPQQILYHTSEGKFDTHGFRMHPSRLQRGFFGGIGSRIHDSPVPRPRLVLKL
ncbi:hypothetical protein AVEN_203063-1 [Araneus ventricosus]|uniref:Uncharacterized protein n=1 Tax=Araneus ventricosus TaxID=182803 RepID=A0A4Y2GAU3_ARAVE|nr:hypothetical protein AVEN_203063-1 [Araneus ventricosus]